MSETGHRSEGPAGVDVGAILSTWRAERARQMEGHEPDKPEHAGPDGRPKVSVILLDWSCRESAHSLDYLNHQTVPREQYELIWIEYYDRVWEEIQKRNHPSADNERRPAVDRWLILNMPRQMYYHKHFMYNVGILYARGEIIVICDSDAIFSPRFIQEVVETFDGDPKIVLHLDQARNYKVDYHPFNYPSIREIMAGAGNICEGKPLGLVDAGDPLHSRNYGACFCARREDLIAIGGADEHPDYLGYVCGPYEMTFRLVNAGQREVWHPTEWTYHVWHPGMAGDNNFVGPHDGRLMSATAMGALQTGRVESLRENEFIRQMRLSGNHRSLTIPLSQFVQQILETERVKQWRVDFRRTVRRRLSGGTNTIMVRSRKEKFNLRRLARRAYRGLWRLSKDLHRLAAILIWSPISLLRYTYKRVSRLVGRGPDCPIIQDGKTLLRAVGIKKGSRVYRLVGSAYRTILAINEWVHRRKERGPF